MKVKGKKNKDQFDVPKYRLKVDKRDPKENLRNRIQPNHFIESSANSDDEEYQQKLYEIVLNRVNRGSEWWRKVNHRFFRDLTSQQLQAMMQRTTTEQLLSLKYPAKKLQTYFKELIVSQNTFLVSPLLLKVLFRRQVKMNKYQHYELVTYSFKEYEQARQRYREVIDQNIHLSSFRYPKYDRVDYEDCQFEKLDIDIIDVEENQQEIKKILVYDVKNMQIPEEIDREIYFWEEELEGTNNVNLSNWDKMIQRMSQAQKDQTQGLDQEISDIKKQLRMTEILLYFKRGHSDKTEQMLGDALQVAMIKQMNLKDEQKKKKNTKIQQLKCMFETDCKICFCTQSDDKNRVVYCDNCNTSFHQACYGIENLEHEQKFYCQVCLFLKKHNSVDKEGNTKIIKKPICQICCKLNFPMRQLNNHFYHITCLVLYDFVEIKDYKIQFKNDLHYNSILQRIVENQSITGCCAFCQKETGMKFMCSVLGCDQYFHPICAYLNGVHFQLARSYRSLKSVLTCANHLTGRDTLSQIYLRRFFCDYKGTSNKTDLEFEVQFKKQLEEKSHSFSIKRSQSQLGVLKKGKLLKSYKCNQPKLKIGSRDRIDLGMNSTKKQSQQILSTPALLNSQTELTETRRLFRMMSEKND